MLDVTDTAALRRVVDKAFTTFGKIDVVVNNAGYGLLGAAEGLTDEQIQHQIATNLIAPMQILRAALPHMRSQGGGRFIVLSTYGGQATYPGASLSPLSNRAVLEWASEPGPENVWVPSSTPTMRAREHDPDHPQRSCTHPFGRSIKMVKAMIDSVDMTPSPRRLVLGTGPYVMMHKALSERPASIEAQKDYAGLTDADG